MLFNSWAYLFFFPAAIFAYFATPQRLRWLPLFISSCVFYAAFIPKYLLILFAIILIDYVAAIGIEHARKPSAKRFLLVASIVANLGILALFKYANWFLSGIGSWGFLAAYTKQMPHIDWVLPIGLSFHTFQSLSYTIEVYRGKFRAEPHLGIYAVYVLFFPQMVAGPIERPQNVIPQLHIEHPFRYDSAVNGLRLMLRGFIKKCVIADGIMYYVQRSYENPEAARPIALVLATLYFAIQIYCDFSGYSDIARGSARIMGIRLMNNFDAPYLAVSIQDFWRRWHISLSTWFRDYLYIPLGGNRCGPLRRLLNILIVFVLSGVWHGASLTFVVWGLLHGLFFLISESISRLGLPGLLRSPALGRFSTLAAVSFAWIYFRAATLADANLIVRRIFDFRLWHVGM